MRAYGFALFASFLVLAGICSVALSAPVYSTLIRGSSAQATLTCPTCFGEFRGDRGLSKHKCNGSSGSASFSCTFCLKPFSDRGAFNQHCTAGCPIGRALPNNPKLQFLHRQDAQTKSKRPLPPGGWEELWYANFCTNAEIGQARAQELQDFISETHGEPKMARYRTILTRLQSGTWYPACQVDQFKLKRVFTNVPPEHGGNDQREVVFHYSDLLDALINSLFDPAVCSGVDEPYILHAEPLYDEEGVRYYVDLASGTWWEETELHMIPKGSCVFPIILYIDETHLTGSGRQAAKPIFAQAGILSPECRARDASWVCVGLMPVLGTASASAESDPVFKSFKHMVYHKCLEALLKPVRDADAIGGFMLRLGPYQKPEEFHPHIALMIQDSQEGYALCSQRISEKTKRPCRFCWITKGKCSDPYATADQRTADQNRDLAGHVKGGDMTPTDKESYLKDLSLSPGLDKVDNGTWGAPFGYPPAVGVNGAAVPDMLHQYLLGLLKTAVTLTKATIKFTAGDRAYKKKLKELDRRFMALNHRHNDPHMPNHRYVYSMLNLVFFLFDLVCIQLWYHFLSSMLFSSSDFLQGFQP